MQRKAIKYVLYLAWLVGMIVLVAILDRFMMNASRYASTTYHLGAMQWSFAASFFFFGVYLSLLCIRKWVLKVNRTLLLMVFLPCALLSLYTPIACSFPSSSGTIYLPLWFAPFVTHGFVQITAGVALMMGLFSGSKYAESYVNK